MTREWMFTLDQNLILKRYRFTLSLTSDKPVPSKQTPMKNHPVFIAQHATATCCRGCMSKWHGIEKGRALDDAEVGFIVELIMGWI